MLQPGVTEDHSGEPLGPVFAWLRPGSLGRLGVEFYESVVQNLTSWQLPPPKRKSEATTQEADTTAENSVLSSAG